MSLPPRAIDFVFFDIGGTLGERDPANNGLVPYPSSAKLLKRLHDEVGLRLGVLTTLGPLTNQQGRDLLLNAGLSGFLDPAGFVSEHDAHEIAKPDARIYHRAAELVSVPLERCLFVGENLVEVIGAVAAGMKAVLKPCPPGRDVSS
jgi:FMN phosphatase YigB (HAD superfamily)